MKTPAWIAATLLALLAFQQVWAEPPERRPQERKNRAQLLPPPEAVESVPSLRMHSQSGKPRLTPEERRKLRRDIDEAGRDIYRHQGGQRRF